MKIAIEIYVSIFILCVSTLLCVGFISADMDVAQARDDYSTYVQQIRDSNFSEIVISGCKSDALERGYTLDVSVHSTDDGSRACYVVLTYDYNIAVLNVSNTKYIRGYVS